MAFSSIHQRFAHKILTVDEVVSKCGDFPRSKKLTMCHGTFDVVHPGHIRHLLFAKSKADFLLVSVTADRHVSKGDLRPHVPQDLRAASLAAYEFVDYVIIDEQPTPLENIRRIRPDFFVKGYDYTQGSLNPRTEAELAEVASYGGHMLFSPGDFVMSSSRLISSSRPDIRVDRLLSVMGRARVDFEILRSTVNAMAEVSVCVIGDVIVDSYSRCSMIGGQTKTPTMSVRFESKDSYVGGAGIVAKHLRAAGANVQLVTLLGMDALGEFVIRDLADFGVIVNSYRDPSRPTTEKDAIVVDQYRLLKVDTLDNSPITPEVINQFGSTLKSSDADVFVFSDFRHGIFNRSSIPQLVSSVPPRSFKVADSQVASRWGNILEFVGFDLVTPNEREARFALGDQDSNIGSLATAIYDRAKCGTLMLKLGERGLMTLVSRSSGSGSDFFLLDSMTHSAHDPVGAGDALLAYASLALRVTGSAEQAAILGSIAAACECERDGNIPVTRSEVLSRIDEIEKISDFS
jgi:rfaE bifunctional protein kinase chain/domain